MDLISKIGLGTVQWGLDYGISNNLGQTSKKEVALILKYSRRIGIDLLDTASAYGNSENVLGENNIEDFKIVSKFLLGEQNRNSILNQLDRSLKRLNIDSLYGYLAHRPMEIINNPSYWKDLNNLKEKGLISKIGFSFNEIYEIKEVINQGFHPDIIQVPYNYFDDRFMPYVIELKNKGCEIHSRSPFLQGLFFMDTSKLSDFFNEVKPNINELQQFGDKLPSVLLKYCISKPFIDKVVFGVNTLNQLRDDIQNLLNVEILPLNSKKINNKILTPSKWKKI